MVSKWLWWRRTVAKDGVNIPKKRFCERNKEERRNQFDYTRLQFKI